MQNTKGRYIPYNKRHRIEFYRKNHRYDMTEHKCKLCGMFLYKSNLDNNKLKCKKCNTLVRLVGGILCTEKYI